MSATTELAAKLKAANMPEAAPSDTDREALTLDQIADLWDFDLTHRWVREKLASRIHDAGLIVVPAAARTSQPVQVEITNESRNRAIEAVADLRGMATQGHMLLSSADIVDAALSAALGGGDQ